jgi:hypothetical protein
MIDEKRVIKNFNYVVKNINPKHYPQLIGLLAETLWEEEALKKLEDYNNIANNKEEKWKH